MPQDDTSVVVLDRAPPPLAPDARPLPVIDDAPAVHDHGDGNFHYDLGNGEQLQLLCLGGGFNPDSAAALVPLGPEGFGRLEAIYRFLAALHDRAVPPDTRLTRQQRSRARRMLQAFDGRRAGATQQEIAQVIFNIGSLDRDEWQASSARHAVKSLLRDARAMIAGGYRRLLRHRRSS
ncbi:hypothetical protein SAMN02982922_0665 [Mesorhizobium australicum]|uniref:T6SS Transcription factor RovC-like DNA binding domain-containing protein n=1 Tax=Mesorhizobium australicum TaxID=536018 RepID=A0A1X7MSW1_9HYPH|nr:hypothetical protein SAMN02982922_0665 [Mesorhizobium australicum]